MRDDIKYLDDYNAAFSDDSSSGPDDFETVEKVQHISIGAKQPSCSFDALENQFAGDPLFVRFRIRLCRFLEDRLALQPQSIKIQGGEQVSHYPIGILHTI